MTHRNTDYAALILRLALGLMFLAHGILKVTVFTLPGTVGFFESVGFPGWMAYLVTYAEIGGGLLLITGLATRWVALALVPILLGAVSVHWGAGWVFSNPNGGWEYPAFLAVATLVQSLLGGGAFALGSAFGERSRSVAHA
ncbi:MAG: DoxX family protein [Gammaproteobacteria bacterium]|jgi:putative oxidoreductase|nr:DoxX family protein [Gammaproteobacteria bacterium]